MTNYQNFTIKITDKFISVRGGCNIHTGYFNISDQTKVAIGPFSSTQLKCPQDNDPLLLKRLTASTSFSISNGILSFLDKATSSIAKFKKLADETVEINAIITEIKNNASSNAANPARPSSSALVQGSTSNQGKNVTDSQQQSTATLSEKSPEQSSKNAKNGGSKVLIDSKIDDLLKGVKRISFTGTYKPTNINNDRDLLIVFSDE